MQLSSAISLVAAAIAVSACASREGGVAPITALKSYAVPWDSHDWAPAWSPDGGKIAYATRQAPDGIWHLAELDLTSGRMTPLTPAATNEVRPQYAPDGASILFLSRQFGDSLDVAVYERATGAVRRIDIPESDSFDENHPVWSPDGQSIYFDATYNGDTADIYRFDLETGSLSPVATGPGDQSYPSVSPDGRLLAYRDDADGDPELYVMSLRDGATAKLTDNTVMDQAATWSPDGRFLVYFSQRTGNPEIFVSRPDGSAVAQLTHSPDWDFMPVFSPDGERIAFDSRRSGRRAIHIINADGTDPRQVTNLVRSALIEDITASGVETALSAYERQMGNAAYREPPFTEVEAGVMVSALMVRGNYADGLRLADAWVSSYPRTLARSAFLQDTLSEVLGHFAYRAERRPTARHLTLLGVAQAKLERNDEARAVFERVLEMKPGDSMAQEGLSALQVPVP